MPLAFNAPPLRITGDGIDVEIEVVTAIRRGSTYERTKTALETGAALTVHRQREPETMTIEIKVSDVEPQAGFIFLGLWEADHSRKTLERLLAAQASDSELRVWNGLSYERTPAGTRVWVLDDVAYETDELHVIDRGAVPGSLTATLTFGESPRFATLFTAATNNASEGLQDVVGGEVDRGRQSTTSASPAQDALIAASEYP